MYIILTIILILVIIYCLSKSVMLNEYFSVYDYEFPLSIYQVNDKCKLTGLINEYDDPLQNMCFYGYGDIPSIYNVGVYQSEVNYDA